MANTTMFDLKKIQESYEKMLEPKQTTVTESTEVQEEVKDVDAAVEEPKESDDADSESDAPTHHYVIFKKWIYPDYMVKENPTLKEGDFEVTAWFPRDSVCFAKNEGHGDCENDVVRAWPDATPEEYADTLDYMKKDVYKEDEGDFLHVASNEDEINDLMSEFEP